MMLLLYKCTRHHPGAFSAKIHTPPPRCSFCVSAHATTHDALFAKVHTPLLTMLICESAHATTHNAPFVKVHIPLLTMLLL